MHRILLASCATVALAACGGGSGESNNQAIPDLNRMEALPPLDDIQPPGNQAVPPEPPVAEKAYPATAPGRARPDRPKTLETVPPAPPPPPPPPPPRRPPPLDDDPTDHGNHSG
ncbi:hypothetical protein [Allosphingosinicella sp.]|jgi:hypothetical protein|uniref:hypothetical protein n=1 Tax=Allosphingosinicella sp. TaxID=2823234 RepID=UPI002F01B7F4